MFSGGVEKSEARGLAHGQQALPSRMDRQTIYELTNTS